MALLPGSRNSPAGGGFIEGSGAPASRCSRRGPKQKPTPGIRESVFSPGLRRNGKGNPATGHHRGELGEKNSVKPSLDKDLISFIFPLLGFSEGKK